MKKGFSDKAISKDALGMDKQYEGITEFIGCCETPMTIAINGDWGSGKSSAMQIIQEKLKKRYELSQEEANSGKITIDKLIIDFNTWEFSIFGENDKLVLELMEKLNDRLDEILKSPDPDDEKNKESDVKSKLSLLKKRIPNGVKNMAVGIINDIALVDTLNNLIMGLNQDKGTNGPKSAADASELYSNTDIAHAVHDSIEKKIDKILARIDGNIPKRLYIFIDDLDRLEPRMALELIEGMKNFVTYNKCVFILAVDQKVVERGLKSKYGSDFDDNMTTNFFDKIIQVPFKLPVDGYDIKTYINALLQEGADSPTPEEVKKLAQKAEKYARLLKAFGEKNPRTIKRSLNLLQLHQCIFPLEENNIDDGFSSDMDIKTYAVLLLQMKSENDHYKFLMVADNYRDKEHADYEEAMAGFTALSDQTDSEFGDTADYIQAVLDVFYPEGQDSIASTQDLISILLSTKPDDDNYNDYVQAKVIFSLYKAAKNAGYDFKKLEMYQNENDLAKRTETLSESIEFDDGRRLDVYWKSKERRSGQLHKALHIYIKPADCQKIKNCMEKVNEKTGEVVFLPFEQLSDENMQENKDKYYYRIYSDSMGIYLNSDKNFKHLRYVLENVGIFSGKSENAKRSDK